MTKSNIFLYLCLAFLGGIFLSSFFRLPQILIFGILILGIALISVLFKHKKLVIIGFCVLFLAFGIYRYQSADLKFTNNDLRKLNDSDKNIVLIGIVFSEPDVGEKNTKLIIKVGTLDEVPEQGKILITVKNYPEYQYGDKLEILGYLKTPSEDINGFNYADYLKKEGIYSIIDFPETKFLGKNFGNPLIKTLLSFKNKFKEIARSFIPFPQEGFLEALVFGDEGNIPKDWIDKLNLTGTRHIAAVSGMNITIISSLIFSFALSVGFWRKQSFYLSVFLLSLYILMIGFPVSAIRAGIMAIIFMVAQYFGRLSSATRAIVFAAVLMLFFNPYLLRFDVGFQLSFLAILGMVYIGPNFTDLLKKFPNITVFSVRETLSATLAAQVFTLPILIYNFGRVSLISPIVNILIVPFLAPLTVLIFTFGILGIIFWGFGQILSWPVWFFLSYLTKVIDLFSKVPRASISIKGIHWIWLFLFYSLLGLAVIRLQKRKKLKFLKY